MASDRERIRAVDEVLHPKPKLQKNIAPIYNGFIEDASEFVLPENIMFEWNPDGTLKEATTNTERMSFVWNSNGTLNKIIKETLK